MKLIIDIPEANFNFIKDLKSLIIGGRGSCKTIQYNVINAIRNGTPYEPKNEWIPIKYRSLTEKERIAFAEHYGIEYCDTSEEKAFDCPMPEDGQNILISTPWGVVEDVVDNDIDGEGFICYGLEANGDWDGVEAWMPKPKRYKKGGKE